MTTASYRHAPRLVRAEASSALADPLPELLVCPICFNERKQISVRGRRERWDGGELVAKRPDWQWKAAVPERVQRLPQVDAAEIRASTAAELGASADALTQTLARQVKAKVLASRGCYGEVEGLDREAISLACATDLLNVQRPDRHDDIALALIAVSRLRIVDLADALARGAKTEDLRKSTWA